MFQSLFYWITYSYYKYKNACIKFAKSFNPYFTGLPILMKKRQVCTLILLLQVSILILLDYLFLFTRAGCTNSFISKGFQSLFYWITYSYTASGCAPSPSPRPFQSLFYWITYSYSLITWEESTLKLNVSILILLDYLFLLDFNTLCIKIKRKVSILILLDYLFLLLIKYVYNKSVLVSILILLDYLFL